MKKTIGLILFSMFLQGCQTTSVTPQFIVDINAYTTNKYTNNETYYIFPQEKGKNINDFEFKAYSEEIDKAMRKKGFVRVNNINEAKIGVAFIYKISEPKQEKYSYSVPIWGQTGTASSSTYGTINSYGNGYGTFSGTTFNTPTYGITGYNNGIGVRTVHERFIKLSAFEMDKYKKHKTATSIWEISAKSVGNSSDLRYVMKFLSYAIKDYIGTDTERTIRKAISEDDIKLETNK